MTTNNWREEFDTKFEWIGESMSIMSHWDHWDWHAFEYHWKMLSSYELVDIIAFIETHIAQARNEVKQQLKEYVDKELKLVWYEHKEIIDYISSL